MKCFVATPRASRGMPLVGGARDKSLDAIHIDEAAPRYSLSRASIAKKVNGGSGEKRSDVLAFADSPAASQTMEAYRSYRRVSPLPPRARRGGPQAHQVARLPPSTLFRHDRAMQRTPREGGREPRAPGWAHADIDIIDGKRVLRLLSDYLDGVAPPVPLLEIELESGQGVTLSGVLQRFDQQTKIESGSCPSPSTRSLECTRARASVSSPGTSVASLGNADQPKHEERRSKREPDYSSGITTTASPSCAILRNR